MLIPSWCKYVGSEIAGGRGYYLVGAGMRLNQALINYGIDFLEKRGYTPLQTPFFMRKDIMARCAQLAQFDEELYKVCCYYPLLVLIESFGNLNPDGFDMNSYLITYNNKNLISKLVFKNSD